MQRTARTPTPAEVQKQVMAAVADNVTDEQSSPSRRAHLDRQHRHAEGPAGLDRDDAAPRHHRARRVDQRSREAVDAGARARVLALPGLPRAHRRSGRHLLRQGRAAPAAEATPTSTRRQHAAASTPPARTAVRARRRPERLAAAAPRSSRATSTWRSSSTSMARRSGLPRSKTSSKRSSARSKTNTTRPRPNRATNRSASSKPAACSRSRRAHRRAGHQPPAQLPALRRRRLRNRRRPGDRQRATASRPPAKRVVVDDVEFRVLEADERRVQRSACDGCCRRNQRKARSDRRRGDRAGEAVARAREQPRPTDQNAAQAIVLRRRDFRESSRIVTVPDAGARQDHGTRQGRASAPTRRCWAGIDFLNELDATFSADRGGLRLFLTRAKPERANGVRCVNHRRFLASQPHCVAGRQPPARRADPIPEMFDHAATADSTCSNAAR